MKDKDIVRFWSKVQKSEDTEGCWLWTGTQSGGAGQFGFDGKVLYAHRVMWTLTHGEIDKNDIVKQVCKNRLCVNPAHLYSIALHDIASSFWSKVKKGAIEDCWIFTGTKNHGYGKIYDGKRMEYAHRFSWRLHYGEISLKQDVCHHCDNPSCVNPFHLFLGTRLDNMHDMISKDRGNRGERHGLTKLTDKDALSIRKLAQMGVKNTEIGRRFNVSRGVVRDVVCKRTFRHLDNL